MNPKPAWDAREPLAAVDRPHARPGVRRAWLPALRCESEELVHLDLMRIVAAVLIVVYHFRNQVVLDGVALSRVSAFANISLGVDLFFVISGIVIAYVYGQRFQGRGGRRGEFLPFLQKRFARLAPLHYATLAFYFVLGAAGLLGAEAWKYQPSCLAPNLVFLQAFGTCGGQSFNHVSWSISAEMLVYLLFPLFVRLSTISRLVLPGLAAVLLAVFYALGDIGEGGEAWHQLTSYFGVLRALPAFLLGMSLWAERGRLARIPRPELFLIGLVALFFLGLATHTDRGLLVFVIYAIAAAALACDVQRRASPWVKRLAPYGALTYGVYMLHPLVRTAGLQILPHLHMPQNLIVLIDFLLVFPVAYLSLFLFEQPMRRLLAPKPRQASPRASA